MVFFNGRTIQGLTELKPYASCYSNLKISYVEGLFIYEKYEDLYNHDNTVYATELNLKMKRTRQMLKIEPAFSSAGSITLPYKNLLSVPENLASTSSA